MPSVKRKLSPCCPPYALPKQVAPLCFVKTTEKSGAEEDTRYQKRPRLVSELCLGISTRNRKRKNCFEETVEKLPLKYQCVQTESGQRDKIIIENERESPPCDNHFRLSTARRMDSTDVDANFNSFNYWKPCLPNIEADLSGLLEEKMDISALGTDYCEKNEDPDFNAFNFWRAPLPDIGFGFDINHMN